MPASRTRPVSQLRLSVLLALLLMMLVLAALVAAEAHEATVSHRVTAERALRDYASVAAWEFAGDAGSRISRRVEAVLGPVTGNRAASPFEPPIAPETIVGAAAGLECAGRPAAVFRLDLRDDTLAAAGGTLRPELAAWLRTAVAADARERFAPDARFATLRAPADARPYDLVAYGVRWAQHGAPMAAYGVVSCIDALVVPALRSTMRTHALLPAAVTGGAPIDSLLDLRVSDAGGRVLLGDELEPTPYVGDAVLDEVRGVSVLVALRPLATERLLVGRPLRSRLPLLIGLLALTCALAVIAVVQLRRERELERMRADFTSSVSHELRTPLAQILLFGETLALERARTVAERRVAAETIVQEARRLMHMVENLLLFSRTRASATELTPHRATLAPVLDAVARSFAPLADAAAVRLVTQLGEDLSAQVDADALRRVVLNLLENAVKYGPSGQTVTLSLEREGAMARIAVDDEGPGIPSDDRDRIWSPYVRLGRDRNAAHGGSGIGLAVVRDLVERMRGEVRVEQAPRGGARFVVVLPLASDVEAPPAATIGSGAGGWDDAHAGAPRTGAR